MRKIYIAIITAVALLTTTIIIGCSCSGCGCSGCRKPVNRSCYQINCTLEKNCLNGEQTVTFYNAYDVSFTELKFNLFANAFRQDAKYSPILPQYTSLAYPNGINYGYTEITQVTSDGQALEYQIEGADQNVLTVYLNEEIYPEERATVEIVFSVKLANVIARTGINDKTINLANFYPILCAYDNGFYECVYYASGDPFFSECADYNVSITTPKEYVVAGGGSMQGESVNGNLKTTQFSLENARSFAMVLSKDFKTVSATVGETNITYYYYNDLSPETSLKFAVESMQLFNEKFGSYPYSTYSVVQTKFVQGGMEYPTITLISDSIEGTAYGEVIVHETAHQWWQTVVGNNEIEHGFLDEGLAEYSVVIYFENHPEHGLSRPNLIQSAEQTYKVFCSVVDRLEGKVDTRMLRGLGEFSTEYEYVNMAYIKPCIMYDYIRTTIGDQKFFSALARYYEEYSFKNAKPDDIVGVFEKTGADTNGFFESFYNGKAII